MTSRTDNPHDVVFWRIRACEYACSPDGFLPCSRPKNVPQFEYAAARQSDPIDPMACVAVCLFHPTQQQKPGTPDPSASHVRLAPARQPYQLLEEEEPFYQAQEQSLFPDDGYHYDDFYVEAPTLMTLDARVQAPLITAKTLSPNLVHSHATGIHTRTHVCPRARGWRLRS